MTSKIIVLQNLCKMFVGSSQAVNLMYSSKFLIPGSDILDLVEISFLL